ncbi:hypothetical protein [Cellulomonas hominis]
MLTDAVQLAHTASPLQRSTAVVLLDGVVERTLHLVAVDRALQPPRNADFFALLELVRADLSGAWQPHALPDVRQLHRARNSAQHEGLAPDRDQLAPWASAAGAFVRGLVEASFNMDLDRVALTDAIRDDDLRTGLEGAAAAIEDRLPGQSVLASGEVLTQADAQWRRLRWAPHTVTSQQSEGVSRGLADALARLERQQRLAIFAQSSSEVDWFTGLAAERPEDVDLDDAERALAFVVSWVLAFEAAKETWTPNRRARADQSARLVRTGDGPAYIESVVQAEVRGEGALVRVRLAAVPGDGFDEWAGSIRQLLREVTPDRPPAWQLFADGTAQIRLFDADQLEEQIALLASVLGRAETAMGERLCTREEAERDRAAFVAEYATAFGMLGDVPDWITGVEYTFTRWSGTAVAFQLAQGLRHLGTPGATPRADISSKINGSENVDRCYSVGRGRYEVQPALEPAAMFALLWSVDSAVQELIARHVEREQELAAASASLRERADGAVLAGKGRSAPSRRGAADSV